MSTFSSQSIESIPAYGTDSHSEHSEDCFDDDGDFSLSELAFVMEWEEEACVGAHSRTNSSGVCPLGAVVSADSEEAWISVPFKKDTEEVAARRKCFAEGFCTLLSNAGADNDGFFKDFSDEGDWRNVEQGMSKNHRADAINQFGSTPQSCAVW
mmetsp:Transcript_67687/g.141107  ORF Transcript_67687/g.141107 Transcript_67687/m.141107 type:complete len:154 (+) Transcript_67687:55-516(+)|eukprot:CAMPEP_0181315340 /NCGR_PEP_ID=MMETSP1101-20121128/15322_1 /TAXON_ID=46948 /ORGANISM="Rhodomonas abbreviata, Strain Caron Lab Isolate" /LENGTH=153 /DNA_ID=CAMNT_0023422539 /DNA_START=210 /DNA_END=668 /DNA_ORIENTATION=-